MISHYTILLVTGLVGALLLLALQVFAHRRAPQKLITAFWLALLVGLWLVLPTEGRWFFSLWTPSKMLGGQLLLDTTPAVWSIGLALGLTLAGVAWVQVADVRPALPLSGGLTLIALLIAWLALVGGSLLTVLAAWALFDLLWGAAGLIALSDGERITFGWLFNGLASVALWAVVLLLEREGGSTLWWLMVPTTPIITLLVGAAVLRIGLYPFHISFPHRLSVTDTLFPIAFMNPILGLTLLYRVRSLPDVQTLPSWLTVLGLLTFVWGGIQTWTHRSSEALPHAAYAFLGLIVVGAGVNLPTGLLLRSAAVWIVGWTLLWVSRPRSRDGLLWSWPGWYGLLFLIGIPSSALGALYRLALVGQGWVGRVLLITGGFLLIGGLLSIARRTTEASISPPLTGQRLSLAAGFGLLLAGLFSGVYVEPLRLLALLLWMVTIFLAVALVWRADRKLVLERRLSTLLSFLDLRWMHRSLWRGTEHILSAVRVIAEVVEGSGALLWSMLVILIVLLIRGV